MKINFKRLTLIETSKLYNLKKQTPWWKRPCGGVAKRKFKQGEGEVKFQRKISILYQ